MHKNNICHRDLKPENIMINNIDWIVKIVDFRASTLFTSEKLTDRQGTPFYIAPEVLNNSYNEKCDL